MENSRAMLRAVAEKMADKRVYHFVIDTLYNFVARCQNLICLSTYSGRLLIIMKIYYSSDVLLTAVPVIMKRLQFISRVNSKFLGRFCIPLINIVLNVLLKSSRKTQYDVDVRKILA